MDDLNSKTIATRRAHMARIKKARIPTWLAHPSKKDIGRRAATAKPCSCWMCGNPRKWTGQRTWQELSAAEFIKKIENPALADFCSGSRPVCDQV